MKSNTPLACLLLIICIGWYQTPATAADFDSDTTPVQTVNKDAKTIVSDYINAIGGTEAIKKLNSIASAGSLTVQGVMLDVSQKEMTPNKTAQVLTMGGNTVGKTIFNGTKGYTEQMGNRTDMGEEDMTDLRQQTSLIEQAGYLTGNAYKLSVLGTDTVNGAMAYKVSVTKPSGKEDIEYYDAASKLLVRKDVNRTVNGQTISMQYQFGDYKKAGDVQLPYLQNLTISAGAITQTLSIKLTDMKVNEGVTDADFD